MVIRGTGLADAGMTREQIEQINSERLNQWGARAINSHATPLLMLSIGHDHKSGELNIHCTEDLTPEQLRGFLIAALGMLGSTITVAGVKKAGRG